MRLPTCFKPRPHQALIVIIPVLVFVFGELFLAFLLHRDIQMVVSRAACISKISYSTKYILVAIFLLALFVASIVTWRSISQLRRANNAQCWVLLYISIGLLVSITFNVVDLIPTGLLGYNVKAPLGDYVKLIPGKSCFTFDQECVRYSVNIINTIFIFASFGVVLSASSLTNKVNAEEIIGCLYHLRIILMQGLGIFITGMMFMHFWMKYAIEAGGVRENQEIVDLAIGIQFYHAILFFSIILFLAMLTHYSLRSDYETSIENHQEQDKNRAHEEWRSAASYYREFITAIGLFVPPLLGIIGM